MTSFPIYSSNTTLIATILWNSLKNILNSQLIFRILFGKVYCRIRLLFSFMLSNDHFSLKMNVVLISSFRIDNNFTRRFERLPIWYGFYRNRKKLRWTQELKYEIMRWSKRNSTMITMKKDTIWIKDISIILYDFLINPKIGNIVSRNSVIESVSFHLIKIYLIFQQNILCK